jgi:cell division protein FtsB
MNETEYQAVISTYQQKAFELFNQNIVYQTQINTLQQEVGALRKEIEQLKSPEHHHGYHHG